MKKIILGIFLLSFSFSFAQKEIKVNIFDALALKTLTVSYEQYITDQTSVGASALFNFEGENSDFRYTEDQMFTAFARHYFSTESLWNFFGEVFVSYSDGVSGTLDNNGTPIDYSDGALGVAAGYKYISSGGFTVDFHAGLGRNLFTDNSPRMVPRLGVNLGFQF
jgi:hypothetical protein